MPDVLSTDKIIGREAYSSLPHQTDICKNHQCAQVIARLAESPNCPNKVVRSEGSLTIDTRLTISDGQKLSLNMITDGAHEKVKKAHGFLTNFFSKDQIPDLEVFSRNINGKTKRNTSRPRYRLFCLTDNKDDIVGIRVMELLPILDHSTGKEIPDKSIIYAIFIVIKEEYRGTGVAKHMYISSLIDALIEAEKEGKEILGIFAECSSATEKLQNAVGLRRIYFQNTDTGSYHEFKYMQPHLDFDLTSGTPSSAEEEPKEHFMLCHFGKEHLSKEDVKDAVMSLYRQSRKNLIREDFESHGAFEKYEEYFDNFERKMLDQIDNAGPLELIDFYTRIEIEKNGGYVQGHI